MNKLSISVTVALLILPVSSFCSKLEQLKYKLKKQLQVCKDPIWKNQPQCTIKLSKLKKQIGNIENLSHQCKKDGYKNCYQGTKWTEQLSDCEGSQFSSSFSMYKDGRLSYDGFEKEIYSCDKYINGIIKDSHLQFYNWGYSSRECKAISLYGILMGRYSLKKITNDDEKYYLISMYKKKYGKYSSSKKCGHFTTYQWHTKDFDILLFSDKENILARYIHIPSFKLLSHEVQSINKKESLDKSHENIKKIKSLGDDI